MAGTIIADDLQHSNNDTVGTEYLIHGSAKVWTRFNPSSNTEIDSLNQSSRTDNGTGKSTINFTNNMNDSVWCGTCIAGSSNRFVINNTPNTTRFKIETYAVSSQSANDSTDVYGVVHGDLA